MSRTSSVKECKKDISKVSQNIFKKDLEFAANLHPRLTAAVTYLSEHYLGDISQKELAEKSGISASHLAYLFRSQLSIRFMALLVELRILYSISLLEQDPRILITDLCLQSGFADLSHFEKMFRRYTGFSPREMRRYVKQRHRHDRKIDTIIRERSDEIVV